LVIETRYSYHPSRPLKSGCQAFATFKGQFTYGLCSAFRDEKNLSVLKNPTTAHAKRRDRTIGHRQQYNLLAITFRTSLVRQPIRMVMTKIIHSGGKM
jgi:hypothetical protein